MYSSRDRTAALGLLRSSSLSQVSRATGISRSTLRAWRDLPDVPLVGECPRCTDHPICAPAYNALLGYYLGDGCISAHPRYFVLRVSCDATYPTIVTDVEEAIRSVRPDRSTFRVCAPGVVVVQSNWKH